MKCSFCGVELSRGATRCPSCGTMVLYSTVQQAPASTNYGPQPYERSHNPYEQNPYTVPNPHSIDTSQQSQYPPPPPPQRPRPRAKVGLVIGSIVVVLIFVSSISVFILLAQRTTSNPPMTTSPSTASPNNVTPTSTTLEKIAYPPYSGTLVLNDPLRDNSKGYNWQEINDTNGSCTFTAETYHVKTVKGGYYYPCTAQSTDFDNFAYEAQMRIIQGDCGALLFRVDNSNTNFYFFRVCQDGSSALYLYKNEKGSTLIPDHSNTAIYAGLNQSNLLAVVAQGSTLNLYVNQQKVASISDSTYSHGQIAVVADGYPYNHPTEVVYSNAKVWKL